MSPFTDDLESQLRAAARAQIASREDADSPADGVQPEPRSRGPRRRGPAWLGAGLRGGLRQAPVLAAVAVTVVVAVGAIALLGRGSRPSGAGGSAGGSPMSLDQLLAKTPQPQLRQEFGYMAAASKSVEATAACRVRGFRGPRSTQSAPGRALLSKLALLRRPATATDQVPGGTISAIGFGGTVYVRYARRALTRDGISYYVVPIRSAPGAGQPTARCFAAQEAALHRRLAHIPSGLRAGTVALQTGYLAYFERLLSAPPQDEICFVSGARHGLGATCGIPLDQITHGRGTISTAQGIVSGVVPDGVATVTLEYPATRTLGSVTVTATVHSNVFAGRLPGAQQRIEQQLAEPRTVIWRSSRGAVLRSVTAPSSAAARAACQHSIACALLEYGGLSSSSGSSSHASGSASATTSTAAPTHSK